MPSALSRLLLRPQVRLHVTTQRKVEGQTGIDALKRGTILGSIEWGFRPREGGFVRSSFGRDVLVKMT